MIFIRLTIITILTILMVLIIGARVHSCTVFYLKNDTVVLAGNNEDWLDPASKMWFYPPTVNAYGWIKFGWGSGFPQGGMNNQGLFWDATSGPHLEMPYSEANKVEYPGALMEKVIRECANVEEARAVFSAYYCQDQYRGQYLVGDAEFNSMIVEGDSIIAMQDNYLVLTNFYHSNPQLGGYPCWRYEIAMDLLSESENYTPHLVGTILSATHQEGNYPTQYSQIYDLIHCRIYLFYYHNFDEFIVINLREELNKGYRSYDIPNLFGKIKLLSPIEGEKISSTSAVISWEGKPGFNYELLYSTDPAFGVYTSASGLPSCPAKGRNKGSVLMLAGLLLVIHVIKNRKPVSLILILSVLLVLNLRCEKGQHEDDEGQVALMSKTVSNLQPNSTYYWKIKATKSNQNGFQSETITRSFTTTDPVSNW